MLEANPRGLRRQAGIAPAMPGTVNMAPRIKPTAPSTRDYGKNPPPLNPANLGQVQ
jgi:hypothetical protein